MTHERRNAPPPPPVAALLVRFLTRQDLGEIWPIIRACAASESHRVCRRLKSLLRQRNCVALVAEVTAGTGKRKVGVLMAEKIMRAVRICFLGVHPRYRRLGIGRRLLERLQESVCGSSVTRIFIYFREDQNELLSFFRACGFRARLRRDFYGEGEDAYEMSKAIGVKLPPTHCFHPRNRLIRRTNIDDLLRGRKRWFS